MPCDQIRVMPLEFKPKNLELLQEAVEVVNKSFGARLRIDFSSHNTGQRAIKYSSIRSEDVEALQALPQEYSMRAIRKSAKRFGWQTDKVQQKGESLALKLRR